MKILIAVVSYNEELNIGRTILDLQENNFGYDIVVIDNSSADDTVNIARRMGVPVIAHCINTGSGAGTAKSYFLYAQQNNYDIVCQFDSDGQHKADQLKGLIAPIIDGKADFVIGSRFIDNVGFQSSWTRRIGIRLFSRIVSIISGLKITDITSGFKAYNQKAIKFFSRYYKSEIYDNSQLLLLCHHAGLRIMEVPTLMQERLYGQSEYNLYNSIIFPIKALISIFGTVLQKSSLKEIQNGIKN